MLLTRKPALIILLAIAGFVFGFIFLLKSCLAKYDERFIMPPALVFEKEGKSVVFSIVQFQKTTSYSQKGGMTSKSVNTSYHVQSNDGITADFISSKKIKTHRQVKNFPVEVLGKSGTNAWVFMGEPMAFDAFTLELKADISILTEKNPSLKDKFPVERQFYKFDRASTNIFFTAKDGSKWELNTQTLKAIPSSYEKNKSPYENKLREIEKEIAKVEASTDSTYAYYRKEPSRKYQDYYPIINAFRSQRDSLQKLRNTLQENKRDIEDRERAIEGLQRTGQSFSELKTNQDTIAGNWFGLYGDEEWDKLNDRVRIDNAYDQTARRSFIYGRYSAKANRDFVINKSAVNIVATQSFLDGGFLLDKSNAEPIRLANGDTRLVVYKDAVGKDGKIWIASVTSAGKMNWSYNTDLVEWTDWIVSGNRLYVFGINNKNLSSSESNVLICLDLLKGTAASFDYFKNKKIN